MTDEPPAEGGLVALHLWGMPRRQLPWVFAQMARPRRPFRGVPGLRFARLLGTSHGRSFTPADADLGHWALLTSWSSADAAAHFANEGFMRCWDNRCFERWHIVLRPLRSVGSWSGTRPFAVPQVPEPTAGGDTCAVITRARLVGRQAVTFWRAVPPVAAALPNAEGLRFARGIGEAPVGLQATFSVWEDVEAVKTFAYESAAHRRVIERTAQTGWYAEQLFARFTVLAASGTVNGRDPLLPAGSGA